MQQASTIFSLSVEISLKWMKYDIMELRLTDILDL
jgi:hypothetical protein